MDPIQPDDVETEIQPVPGCANCNTPIEVNVNGSRLCPPCRESFIRYPIPLWIKLFGVSILLVMVLSLFGLPESFSSGIHLRRGKNAAEAHRYVTAQNEFQILAQKNPGFLEAQGRLLIAAFYNSDLNTMSEAFSHLKNKEVKDEDLYADVSSAIAKTKDFFPGDSLTKLLAMYNNNYDSIPGDVFYSYTRNFDDDHYAKIAFANKCINENNYHTADSVLNVALDQNRDDLNVLGLKTAVKRYSKQLDSAYYFINRMLAINEESVFAIAVKSRVMLTEKKYADALKVANEAHTLDYHDGYALASLALAKHFTGDIKGRDQLIQQAEKDSTLMGYFSYVRDVISGKENLK